MAMIDNIFNSQKGSMIPDVNINSKAFDNLSIVKRLYDQVKTSQQDLARIRTIPPVVPFARATAYSNSMSEGEGDIQKLLGEINANNGLARPNWLFIGRFRKR